MAGANQACVFCQIDEKIVAFQDIKPAAQRFGSHQPPFNSVDHLHLHCLSSPFVPRRKAIKYKSLEPLGRFIEAETLLEKIRPLPSKAEPEPTYLTALRCFS